MNIDDFSSKKIKRLREQKFTKIRSPYKRYQKANFIWADVFNEIKLLKLNEKYDVFSSISNKYGIKYKTLTNKYYDNEKIKDDVKDDVKEDVKEDVKDDVKNKINIVKINCENRGGINKSLTEADEKEIFIFLKSNFIDRNRMLCDEIIKLYAIHKYKQLYKNENFKASNGWCYVFKKRWNLSTVRCSISKNAKKIYTEDEIDLFLRECLDAVNDVGFDFFF